MHIHVRNLERLQVQRGFTLLELLLVVGILAILAGSIAIVAINPSKQFGQAKNAERESHVNTILNAVYQYTLDNDGTLPTSIPSGSNCTSSAAYEICQDGASSCSGLVDLSALTASELYLVSIPLNPGNSSTNGTGYNIVQSTNGRVTVCANGTDLGEDISATK